MYTRDALLASLLVFTPASSSAAPRPVAPRTVVVIDPGHGGSNLGCRSWDGHVHEKELTLAMALQLRAKLSQVLPHAHVVLTRERDRALTLQDRVGIANRVGGDLFVSLHANASPDGTQEGFETYLLDRQASSLEAARTASRENDDGFSRPRRASPVPAMVRELGLASSRARAGILGRAIQREQGARFPRRIDRGVKQAPFDVLAGVRMPAVLFEVAFLDNPVEGAAVLDDGFQEQAIDGLAAAIVRYYRDVHAR